MGCHCAPTRKQHPRHLSISQRQRGGKGDREIRFAVVMRRNAHGGGGGATTASQDGHAVIREAHASAPRRERRERNEDRVRRRQVGSSRVRWGALCKIYVKDLHEKHSNVCIVSERLTGLRVSFKIIRGLFCKISKDTCRCSEKPPML